MVPGWGFVHNYDQHFLGRIWICWNPKLVSINSIQQHEQAISCEVITDQGNLTLFQTFVCGAMKGLERKSL